MQDELQAFVIEDVEAILARGDDVEPAGPAQVGDLEVDVLPVDRSLTYETIAAVKPAIFHPEALRAIRAFPPQVRRPLVEAIYRLQHGDTLAMPLSRGMPSVAPGVAKLRIHHQGGMYRCSYYVRSGAGVLVFHAFIKKSQATPKHEIEIGRKRLKEMV